MHSSLPSAAAAAAVTRAADDSADDANHNMEAVTALEAQLLPRSGNELLLQKTT